MDTIFALASARGKAGVAVIRLSGPAAHQAVMALCGDLPETRRASVRRITWQGAVLDEALVLTFADGASFTGEAAAEFHCHGSRAVIAAVTEALIAQGLRLAEPGEFTRRALEHGRLDLAQVEGLADLIDAETEAQRRQALGQMTGQLRALADGWRVDLIRAAALIEATIDFADEDVPVDVAPEVLALIARVMVGLRAEVAGFGAAERLRDGFEVAILGRPNAGKSTLLNALAGREAAITSTVAGTTRDVIEVRMDLGGLPVTLLDTAGLRETGDEVEQIGIARGLDRARRADLRLFLLDGAGSPPLIAPQDGDLLVQGKADLLGGDGVSGLTGQGLSDLIAEIGRRLEGRAAGASSINRIRHLQSVERAISALESATDRINARLQQPELAAESLRAALRALDGLIGRVDVEMLLDEIFRSFCIGK